jgi:AcrR family transcriptional regulator
MRVKRESRRQAIMDVAETLFREKGFELTSMDEITARVGGSKATLYNYFASKQELFLEVMRRFARDIMARLYDRLDPQADMRAVLSEFGENFLEFVCQPRIISVQRVVYAESGRAGLGQDFYQYGPLLSRTRLAEYLQGCMDRGLLRQGDATRAAAQLLALWQAEHIDPLRLEAVPMDRLPPMADSARAALDVFLRAYGVG